jgi:rhodanese-related sulfurtransferase
MPEASFHTLDADQALAYIFSAYEKNLGYSLFDTRDADSYARGHLPGAEPLAERDIGHWIDRLPRSQPVLIYCYHGNASQQYAKAFADFGYSEVYSVDGGFHALAHAWQRARRAARAAEQAAKPAPSTTLLTFMANEDFTSADINAARANGMTPLMTAARSARLDLVDELLMLGADREARNSDGNTALWLACFGNDAQVVGRLIGAGAKLDNRNDNGATALMYCASSGRDVLVRMLLDAGADADLRTLDGFRAIDLSASVECLRLLRHAC